MKLKININVLKFFLKITVFFIAAKKRLHMKCTIRLYFKISQIFKNLVDPQKVCQDITLSKFLSQNMLVICV